ncbi:rhomboid family intramembrane serine protease [Haloimpatiens sp. FM7330]|uniref:rhomboid family intramembrane serine protease n=1 Tax=Haloimpatiens sp. FM7330 TaxID=3298610 RepID=UPI00362D8702
MNNKKIDFFIYNLSRMYGYTIEEFFDEYGKHMFWAVKKEQDDEIKFIIFLDENNSNNENKFENIILSKYNIHNEIKIIKVFLKENNESNVYTSKDKIIYNTVQNKVYYFDEFVSEEANEIGKIVQNINVQNRKDNKDVPIITYILIGINVLMYIITAYLSHNIFNSNIQVLVYLGAKYNPLIASGQYYRLVACMFLHGGLMHLVLNMYGLYALGPLIEKIYGKIKYIIIYFTAGIASSYVSYMFSDSVSIGASGAIFGLLGAALILGFKMKNIAGKQFKREILSVIFINVIIGLSIPNIDNFGHFGGLVGGVVSSLLLINLKKVTSDKGQV